MAVPDPPADLHPRLTTWPAGRTFSRIHALRYAATRFSRKPEASIHGRFHFFASADGVVVPVLYGAENDDAAIAEVLFRNVPLRGAWREIRADRLHGLAISAVTPKRPLSLIELLGHGLRRLGLSAEELTSTDRVDYPQTVAWARHLHETARRADGLVWMSRQFNAAQALMLFGDRVHQQDLECGDPLELSFGEGPELVQAAATAAEIIITP
jgi:RES domain